MDRAQALAQLDSTKQAIGITPEMDEEVVLEKLDSNKKAPLYKKYIVEQPQTNANFSDKVKAKEELIIQSILLFYLI